MFCFEGLLLKKWKLTWKDAVPLSLLAQFCSHQCEDWRRFSSFFKASSSPSHCCGKTGAFQPTGAIWWQRSVSMTQFLILLLPNSSATGAHGGILLVQYVLQTFWRSWHSMYFRLFCCLDQTKLCIQCNLKYWQLSIIYVFSCLQNRNKLNITYSMWVVIWNSDHTTELLLSHASQCSGDSLAYDPPMYIVIKIALSIQNILILYIHGRSNFDDDVHRWIVSLWITTAMAGVTQE